MVSAIHSIFKAVFHVTEHIPVGKPRTQRQDGELPATDVDTSFPEALYIIVWGDREPSG